MRLTSTVLVALQASMGLSHAIPPEAYKHKEQFSELPESYKKHYHGFGKTTKVTTHRYFSPSHGDHAGKEGEREYSHNDREHEFDDESDDESDDEDDEEDEEDEDEEDKPHATKSLKPGYENVIAGYEWAGPNVVTETPCPSIDGCPQGHWYDLPPVNGVSRIAQYTFVPATATPSPSKSNHHEPEEDENAHKFIHRHGKSFSKRGDTSCAHHRVTTETHHQDGYSHSGTSYTHRMITETVSQDGHSKYERRAPCEIKRKKKVFDPNAPLPRLNTHQLLNIEGIPQWKKKYVAKKLPLDEETKKDFREKKELDAEMITKLNELYAVMFYDNKYRHVKDFLNRPSKYTSGGTGLRKREPEQAPRLTQEDLNKLIGLPGPHRIMVANMLEIDKDVATEFYNAKEFRPQLIEKLNKEYARVWRDRKKYKNVLKKIGVKWKRYVAPSPKLRPDQLERLIKAPRYLMGYKLDFDKKLRTEFGQARKITPELIERLNKAYARCLKRPKKYNYILRKLDGECPPQPFDKRTHIDSHREGSEIDSGLDEEIEELLEIKKDVREHIAKELNFDINLTEEFVLAKKLTTSVVDKFKKALKETGATPKTRQLLEKLVDKHEAKQAAYDQERVNISLGENLKTKTDKSERKGWCKEFLGELEDTLNVTEKEAKEKKD
ncbi:uncharacterized protein FTOL_12914 [Fusarium torulosum]|uniref:Uncharacterized protein n=1 Tax=Fusarium torulosum TaxID=33205 RepID=A0AAE8SPF6_9HYPO|nr:uncharacterized protein FTOL_12914 [Fusarium torulosum]